jgi:hypothetical protein
MSDMEKIVAKMLAEGVDPNKAFLDALNNAKAEEARRAAAAAEQKKKNKEIADARHKAARAVTLYCYHLGLTEKDDIDAETAELEKAMARVENIDLAKTPTIKIVKPEAPVKEFASIKDMDIDFYDLLNRLTLN